MSHQHMDFKVGLVESGITQPGGSSGSPQPSPTSGTPLQPARVVDEGISDAHLGRSAYGDAEDRHVGSDTTLSRSPHSHRNSISPNVGHTSPPTTLKRRMSSDENASDTKRVRMDTSSDSSVLTRPVSSGDEDYSPHPVPSNTIVHVLDHDHALSTTPSADRGHANTATSSTQRFILALKSSEKDVLLRVLGDHANVHGDDFIWEPLGTISEFLDVFQSALDTWHNQSPCVDEQAVVTRRASRLLIKMSLHARTLPNSLFLRNTRLMSMTAISGGGYADIFLGTSYERQVALKRVRVFTTNVAYSTIMKNMTHEALTWRQLRHANVLPFFGIDAQIFNGVPCLISPWMPKGNILNYLQSQKTAGKATLGLIERLSLEIINGLVYLHSQWIVHGDLRGVNILVDDTEHARLADFGLARIVSETATQATTSSRGSIRWMAPEQIGTMTSDEAPGTSSVVTRSIDVYSFACVLLELYTLKVPFLNIKADPAVTWQVMQGKHPQMPQPQDCIINIPGATWTFMQECWSANPATRIDTFNLINKIPIHEAITTLEASDSANALLDLSRLRQVPSIIREHIVTLLSMPQTLYGCEGRHMLLHRAVVECEEGLLDALLLLGVNVETCIYSGRSLLSLAAEFCDERIVNTLISHGADVNTRDGLRQSTPLLEALLRRVSSPLSPGYADVEVIERIAKTLLLFGADANTHDDEKVTPLHLAVRHHRDNVVMSLLLYGADPNARDGKGCTPLQYATGQSIFTALLSHGADVDARDKSHSTLLHKALTGYRDNEIIINILLSYGADVNARDNQKRTPLHLAVQYNHSNMVISLLLHGAAPNTRDDNDCTPLHYAKSQSVVAALLSHGADVNARDSSQCTPLHYAESQSVVAALLSHGADVNARDNSQSTPLHKALIGYGDKATVSTLLSSGADVNARDNEKRTPLHLAAQNDDESNVISLLSHGADVNARDKSQSTPLHKALRGYGYEETVSTLLSSGADVNARDNEKRTPLHLAAQKDDESNVISLLSHGADLNARDDKDCTPLHYVEDQLIFAILLSHGANVNARNNNQRTPLHEVLRHPRYCVYDLERSVNNLLSHGADIHARDNEDRTPFDYAIITGKNVSAVIRSHLAALHARDALHDTPQHEDLRRAKKRSVATL